MTLHDIRDSIQTQIDRYLETYLNSLVNFTISTFNREIADNVPVSSAFDIALDLVLPVLIEQTYELNSKWSGGSGHLRNFLEATQRNALISTTNEIYRRRESRIEYLAARNWDQELTQEVLTCFFRP